MAAIAAATAAVDVRPRATVDGLFRATAAVDGRLPAAAILLRAATAVDPRTVADRRMAAADTEDNRRVCYKTRAVR